MNIQWLLGSIRPSIEKPFGNKNISERSFTHAIVKEADVGGVGIPRSISLSCVQWSMLHGECLPGPGTQCKTSISIHLKNGIIHHDSKVESFNLLFPFLGNIK